MHKHTHTHAHTKKKIPIFSSVPCFFFSLNHYLESTFTQIHQVMLFSLDGNVSWCSHYGKQYGGSSKHYIQNYHLIPSFHFHIYIRIYTYLKETRTLIQKDISGPMFCLSYDS